jgi:molybdopterin molybdotransferase
MIEFAEAFGIVMKSVIETQPETISFSDSCNRILAEDISSDLDMPPFNRSAVDGYACHSTDLNEEMEVVEVIRAGKAPTQKVGKKQCSKIMTGAIVPEGCDLVFMVEDSENLKNGRIRFTGSGLKINISLKGEDVRTGDVVLKKNRFIKPQDLAIMAAVGHTSVLVKKKPVVGIISTGDELIDPSRIPEISQIRNSNAYQLVAQVIRAGGIATNHGIAPDNESATYKIIEKAIGDSDIVIITGGVSMGDFDYVPIVLKQAGVKIIFDRVNVQPGKPTTFGIHPDAVIFGLPGNPVSSFIQFEMLVRPLISRMMDYEWKPGEHKFPMAMTFNRRSSDKLGLIPVFINKDMEAVPVDFHGSAHITALSGTDGIIFVDPGITTLRKGEIVNVRQI